MKRTKTHYLKTIGESGVAESLCGHFAGQCVRDVDLVTCRLCIVTLREPVLQEVSYPRPAPQHMQRTGCRVELRIDKEIAERAQWGSWQDAMRRLRQWRDDGFPMKSPSDPGRFEAVSMGKAEADGDRAQRIAGDIAIVAKLRDEAFSAPWIIQHTPRLELSADECTMILDVVVSGRARENGLVREPVDPAEIAMMVTEAKGFEVTKTDIIKIKMHGATYMENGLYARGLVSRRDTQLQVVDMAAEKIAKPWDYDSVNEIADALDQSPTTIRRWMSDEQDPLPTMQIRGKTVGVKAQIEAWLSRHTKAA